MLFLQMLLPALAFLLLGAHFLRAGLPAFMFAALALVALAFRRRPWAARILQVSLLLGSLEWLRTLALRVAERRELGLPYLRLVLILGCVSLATGLCTLVFRFLRVRRHFRLEEPR